MFSYDFCETFQSETFHTLKEQLKKPKAKVKDHSVSFIKKGTPIQGLLHRCFPENFVKKIMNTTFNTSARHL